MGDASGIRPVIDTPGRFQSTPVIADGRRRNRPLSLAVQLLFQSTPVIADGRRTPDCHRRLADGLFQSTPVIADGRRDET